MARIMALRSWHWSGAVARSWRPCLHGQENQWPGLCYCGELPWLAILATVLTVASADAGVIKLNGELVAYGDVDDRGLQFSPDGSRVLYRADQETDEIWAIYSVPSAGGMSVKLNGELVAGGDVGYDGLQFGPDSARVLYWANQDQSDAWEIYSVLGDGGTPVKLNGDLVSGGSVSDSGLQFSPDGSRVLYRADQESNEVYEIYSVPSAGGTEVKLNGDLVVGGDVSSGGLQFSSDGSRVLYRADQDTNGVYEIYMVPGEGGTEVKLNGDLVVGGSVSDSGLQFSPDGVRVLYLADEERDGVFEIYSVSSTGGMSVKLNGDLGAGGDVSSHNLKFSPDGSRVLYFADQEADAIYEIYSVPSDGGTEVKLNGDLVVGGNVSSGGLQFSPDGSRVLYHADQETNGVYEIYSVSSVGGTSVKLNGDLVAGGDVSLHGLQFSPDGSRVLYHADQETSGIDEIYMVPSAGGTPVKLNGDLVAGGVVDDDGLQFSPDGARVLYLADEETDGVFEIFTRVVSQGWSAASGQWDGAGNWDQGAAPDEVMAINIRPESFATVTGPAGDTSIFSLDIGAVDTGVATLTLQPEVTLTVLNQAMIAQRGALTGSGHFLVRGGMVNEGRLELEETTVAAPTIENHGVLRGSGVVDGAVTNHGRIEVIGGDLEFIAETTNVVSTGSIMVRDATLRFGGGMVNQGSMGLSFGTSDIFGNIDNDGGTVVVSGASNVSFYDDLVNNGTVRVSEGSMAVYFGSVSGTGSFTGSGTNFFEGDLSPGSSPGSMSFEGDVVLGTLATTEVELAGVTDGDYDRLLVAGTLEVGGGLAVALLDGFVPAADADFQIFDAGTLSGTFSSVLLPDLPGMLSWDSSHLYSSGTLSVIPEPATLPLLVLGMLLAWRRW